MEKRVYMPTMDTLYKMQENNGNVYGYLTVKAAESLIMYGLKYPNAGILKNSYNYLREDYGIALAICKLYPEEIRYSEVIQNDVNFCSKFLDQKVNAISGKYYLDYLGYFSKGVSDNVLITRKVIDMLAKELVNNPKYRFEYRSSPLVDKIINGEFTKEDLRDVLDMRGYSFEADKIIERVEMVLKLAQIEPSYALTLMDDSDSDMVTSSINKYLQRYGISPSIGYSSNEYYYNRDILSDSPLKVKRLFKCIEEKNK